MSFFTCIRICIFHLDLYLFAALASWTALSSSSLSTCICPLYLHLYMSFFTCIRICIFHLYLYLFAAVTSWTTLSSSSLSCLYLSFLFAFVFVFFTRICICICLQLSPGGLGPHCASLSLSPKTAARRRACRSATSAAFRQKEYKYKCQSEPTQIQI